MGRKLHFFGWDRPVQESAVEFLVSDKDSGLIDLSADLVIVPTQHSGRRLSDRLALLAAVKQTAVLPGLIVSPRYLLTQACKTSRISGKTQSLSLWIDVLLSTDLSRFPILFSSPPANKDFSWAMSIGRHLLSIQSELGDNGYTIQDLCTLDHDMFEEEKRWNELAALAELFFNRVHEAGLAEANQTQREAISRLTLPPEIKRIVMIAVPDPTPLAVTALEHLSTVLPVDICVHAPSSMADYFDDWGRPRSDKWHNFETDIASENITLAGKTVDQADAVATMVLGKDAVLRLQDTAIGAADELVIPQLKTLFARNEVATFSPQGEPLSNHPLFLLITSLSDILSRPQFEAYARLLRNPYILDYLTKSIDNFSVTKLMHDLDRIQGQFMPYRFSDVTRVLKKGLYPGSDLQNALTKVEKWISQFSGADTCQTVRSVLAEIFSVRELSITNESDRLFRDVSEFIISTLDELDSPVIKSLNVPAYGIMDLLLLAMQTQSYYPDRHGAELDLLGWLELPWEDAPNLIITGMNDGCVPASIVGDLFLPEKLRRFLGLKTNDQRFARDAYLLTAICESRRHTGDVKIIVGKTNDAGDILKPSRLLFLCDDSSLSERASRLFRPMESMGEIAPREIDWKLVADSSINVPETISVTALRDYLICPYRFYLKRILHMKEVGNRKRELDPSEFGSLCHYALERFGRDEEIRDSTDEQLIADFLADQLNKRVRETFGSAPPVLVSIQTESIRQRLEHAARIQAGLRSAGWRIAEVEKSISCREPWSTNIMITAKCDRIDINDNSGNIRIYDYKTSDQKRCPVKAHMATLSNSAEVPDFIRFESRGRSYRWMDLQLPLYFLMLYGEYRDNVECGYFNLPKAVGDTGIAIWDDFDPALIELAATCAEGITSAVKDKRFWPPAAHVEYDEYSRILLGDALAFASSPVPTVK